MTAIPESGMPAAAGAAGGPPGTPPTSRPQRVPPVVLGLRRFARNRLAVAGGAVVLALVVVALLAPWLAPYDPVAQDYSALLKAPSHAHLLGTDNLGRDVLSRLIFGARLSILAGIISVGLGLVIGLPIGLLSGYVGGFWDESIVMRVTDALLAFPPLVLALAIAAMLGPSFTHAMLAIGIGFAPIYIRLVRGQVLSERQREYVTAGSASGAGNLRQMFRHILPNILSPIMVQSSLLVATAIIAEASLSYLGLGTQPPVPSWGSSLRIAQGYLLQAPWMAWWPGVAIFVVVLAFNLLGDGLRDSLDPRLRNR